MAISKDTKKKAMQAKMHKVMHEFKHGELKSSDGKKVKDRSQAIAIAMSETKKKYGVV